MVEDAVIVRSGQEQEFVAEAQRKGFESLLILYVESDAKKMKIVQDFSVPGVTVKTGVIIEQNTVSRWTSRFEEIVVLGTMFSSIPKGVTLLCDNEYEKEKDYTHQRRSGVSHVTLADCRQKGVGLSLGPDDEEAVVAANNGPGEEVGGRHQECGVDFSNDTAFPTLTRASVVPWFPIVLRIPAGPPGRAAPVPTPPGQTS